MRIDANAQHRAYEVYKQYRDVFEEYNEHVEKLAISLLESLSQPMANAVNAQRNIESIQNDINQLKQKISEKEIEMTHASENRELAKRDFIARERDKYINSQVIFTDEEIRRIELRMDNTTAVMNELKSLDEETLYCYGIDREDIRLSLQAATQELVDCYNLCLQMEDNLGCTFGYRSTDGTYWTDEFNDMRDDALDYIEANPSVVEQYSVEVPDADALRNLFAKNYKNNPFKVMNIFVMLLLTPVYFIMRKYRLTSLSEGIKTTIESAMNRLDMPQLLLGLFIWLAEFSFVALVMPMPARIIYLIFVLSLLVVFTFTRKSASSFVCDLEARIIYYSEFVNVDEASVDDKVVEAVDKQIKRLYDELSTLSAQLSDMKSQNEQAKRKAAQLWRDDSVDLTNLDNEIQKMLKEYRAQIQALNKELADRQEKANTFKSAQGEALDAYNDARSKVLDILKCNERGMSLTTVKNGDGSPFDYMCDYITLKCLTTGNSFNTFMSDPKYPLKIGGTEPSDLTPNNFIVGFKQVNLIELAKNNGLQITQRLLDDFNKVLAEFDSYIRHGDSETPWDISQYDYGKDVDGAHLYQLELAPYRGRGSIIFYDSRRDKNAIRSVSEFLTKGVYKPIAFSTDPRYTQFRFIVRDQSAFRDMDPMNKANTSQLSAMAMLKPYSIYDKNDKNKLYKELSEKDASVYREVRAGNYNNYFEWFIDKKATGSSPLALTYLILWEELDDIVDDELVKLLNQAGGTQSQGANVESENVSGIVPIIAIDTADIFYTDKMASDGDKPDKSKIKALREVIQAVCPNNFFQLNPVGTLLTTYSRDVINAELRKADDVK